MIKDKVQVALNKQLNAEAFSAYLYLSMAAYLESINMSGMAKWMRIQAKEEWVHTMKFYDFIIERGGKVSLAAIEAPQTKWASPLKAFEEAYRHELKITGGINQLVELSAAEKDHATANFLQWFVKEQVEEELNADQNVQHLKMVGESSGGLLVLDHHMAKREG